MLSLQHKLQCSGSAPASPGTRAQLGQGQHEAPGSFVLPSSAWGEETSTEGKQPQPASCQVGLARPSPRQLSALLLQRTKSEG